MVFPLHSEEYLLLSGIQLSVKKYSGNKSHRGSSLKYFNDQLDRCGYNSCNFYEKKTEISQVI